MHLLHAIDPSLIGERLAEARRARRLTQQQAADELGVARTTIAAMEKGVRRPRATELVKLAHLYGRPVSDFVRAEMPLPPDSIVQFRGAMGIDEPGDNTAVHRFAELWRWYVELEEQLGALLPRRYPAIYDVSGTFPELPLRYVTLAVQAYEQGLLTEGQLGERLGTDRVGTRERVLELRTEPQPAEDVAR